MGKLYTLDNKLLTETPELRIGEKIYPVDNRQKTVQKIMKLTETMQSVDAQQAAVAEIMNLALGPKAAKEIDDQNLPYPAQQSLFVLLIAAVTGEDADEAEARFQAAQKQESRG